jgi:hypothetical protein
MRRRLRLYLAVFSICLTWPAPPAQSASRKPKKTESSDKSLEKQNPRIQKNNRSKSSLKAGAAAGIHNLYIPGFGLEGLIELNGIMMAGEYSFFQLSGDKFSAKTAFFGLGLRWQPNREQPLFFGLTVGSRKIEVSTVANMNFTDSESGGTAETPVTWTRSVSQTVIYPKCGWIWHRSNSATILGLGLVVPLATKASIKGSPSSVSGISDDAYASVGEEKLRDVTSKTNLILPAFEFKYVLLFN